MWLYRVWVTLKRAVAEGLIFASLALFIAAYAVYIHTNAADWYMMYWSYLGLLFSFISGFLDFLDIQNSQCQFELKTKMKSKLSDWELLLFNAVFYFILVREKILSGSKTPFTFCRLFFLFLWKGKQKINTSPCHVCPSSKWPLLHSFVQNML